MDDPAADYDSHLTCLEHAHYNDRIAELVKEALRQLEQNAEPLWQARPDE